MLLRLAALLQFELIGQPAILSGDVQHHVARFLVDHIVGDRQRFLGFVTIALRDQPFGQYPSRQCGHYQFVLLTSVVGINATMDRNQSTADRAATLTTQTVISALIKQAKTLPNELYKSLTWDRGKELTDHRRFTLATNIDVYFCDPQSPWQRGSNENTNRLLRQYFPKGTDLSVHSQTHLSTNGHVRL